MWVVPKKLSDFIGSGEYKTTITPFTVRDFQEFKSEENIPIEELYKYHFYIRPLAGSGGWIRVVDGMVIDGGNDYFS